MDPPSVSRIEVLRDFSVGPPGKGRSAFQITGPVPREGLSGLLWRPDPLCGTGRTAWRAGGRVEPARETDGHVSLEEGARRRTAPPSAPPLLFSSASPSFAADGLLCSPPRWRTGRATADFHSRFSSRPAVLLSLPGWLLAARAEIFSFLQPDAAPAEERAQQRGGDDDPPPRGGGVSQPGVIVGHGLERALELFCRGTPYHREFWCAYVVAGACSKQPGGRLQFRHAPCIHALAGAFVLPDSSSPLRTEKRH